MGVPFGELLRRHRRAARLTQEALAERSGLSVEAVSALERGWRRAPRRDTVGQLADALDLATGDRDAFTSAAQRLPRTVAPAGWPPPLPVPPTPLVGRETEVAAVAAAIRSGDVRLLTLTGVGGAGKTRIALAAAAALAGDVPDGVVHVELAAIADADQVGAAILEALQCHEASDRPLLDQVAAHVGRRRLLLLLDNFEHLLPAAPFVAALLERCPALRLLVTSRTPLRVRGEHLAPVPALSGPDALALFVQRATAAAPGFRLDEASAEPVAEICRRLDGLPLALELTAPWLNVLSPPALLARLDHRLPAIATGGPDLPERQRTITGALQWSHDLLTPTERVLLRRLSVFAGRFDPADAEAVCAGPGLAEEEVIVHLARLAEASLVATVHGPEGRTDLRLLHTVRWYAAEQLERAGEAGDVGGRHARHYLRLAEEADRAEWRATQAEWLERLIAAHADLRAALSWFEAHDQAGLLRVTTALGWFWLTHGRLEEGRAWLTRVLAATAPGQAERTRVLYLLARLAYWQADYRRARELVEESLALAWELEDSLQAGWSLNLLGYIRGSVGETGPARRALNESLEATGDEDVRVDSLLGLGDLLLREGALAEARMRLEEATGRALERDSPWQVGRGWLLLGIAATLAGDDASAARCIRDGMPLLQGLGNWYALAGALDVAAALAIRGGTAERALRLAAAAEELRTRIVAPLPEGWSLLVEAIVLEPARAALGPDVSARAWTEGTRLSMADAIGYALEGLPVEA